MAEKIVTEYEIATQQSIANLQAVSNKLVETDKNVNKLATDASKTLNQVSQGATKATTSFNGLNNSVAQIGRELPNFALNAQTGFLAISNNLPILFDNLQRVKEENIALAASGQKTTSVFKQVASSIFSLKTALTLVITLTILYGKEIGNFLSALFKGNEALDAAKVRLEALNAAYDSKELKNAVKSIITLEQTLKSARTGVINKEIAIKEYNETLGVAFGKVTSLEKAEQGLIKNTRAYVDAVIAREAANKVASDAAQTIIDIRRKEIELDDELQDKNQSLFQQFREGVNIGQQITDQGVQRAKDKRANAIREELDELKKKYQTQVGLMETFSTNAEKANNKQSDALKSAFQILQSELSKTEDEFKSAKLEGLDTTKIEAKFKSLKREVENVQLAFDELTGEAAKRRAKELEDTINAAINEAERFSSEANRIGAIDLKKRLGEIKQLSDAEKADTKENEIRLKQNIQNELLTNEQLFFQIKQGKKLNSTELLQLEQQELKAKIDILERFKDADDATKKALLDAQKQLEENKTKITKAEAEKRAEFERMAIQGALGLAASFEQGLFQTREANLRNETSIQLEELEKQKENRTISEQQFNQKKSQLLNDQAQKQRELDLAQIKVQTALSIIRTFAQFGFTPAGLLAAAFAATEGALQYSFAASQPLPRFARGTERVQGGVKGQDSVLAMLMPDEAVIPAKRNLERPELAKAWISGDLDRHLTMNYIRPAIEENNKKWEREIKINQNSQFIRNDNFNDKRIVNGLEKINRKLNATTGKVVYKRNRRLWN